jgi:hypothetical protein
MARSGAIYVPFNGGTFPYAVDTTAGKWKFKFTVGGGSGTILLLTSNTTAACYATWCDTQISFTNDDTLIVADPITIDQSFSTGGILSTGDTFKIPAGVWHRVIKGAGNLKVKIKEHGKIGNN